MEKPIMIPTSRSIRTLLLAATMAASFTGAAIAQDAVDIDWKKAGKWENLASHIGTYKYDSIFNDSAVKTELAKITKGTDINLSSEFEVKAPIGFENDCLILKGNQPHKGDTNRSYLEVCLFQGTINLAVYDHDKITVYTDFKDYRHLSDGMRSWIYFQNNSTDVLAKRPDNVQLVVQPQ